MLGEVPPLSEDLEMGKGPLTVMNRRVGSDCISGKLSFILH